MSDFTAIMHQIQSGLGIPPRSPLGDLTVLPKPLLKRERKWKKRKNGRRKEGYCLIHRTALGGR